MLRRLSVLLPPIVLLAGSAQAATLSTPLVGAGGGRIVQCIVTNVGTKPAAISVRLFNSAGVEVAAGPEACGPGGELSPKASCAVTSPPATPVACVVTSSSRAVRAAVEVFEGSDIVTAIAATAK